MTQFKGYTILDSLRGASIISMVLYHTIWDLTNIFNVPIPWFGSQAASIWQASIRWTFICFPVSAGLCEKN